MSPPQLTSPPQGTQGGTSPGLDPSDLTTWISQSLERNQQAMTQSLELAQQSILQQVNAKFDSLRPQEARYPLDSSFTPSAPTCQDSAGRARAVTDPGQEVASVLGIQPRTNWQIVGDRDSIELSKVRKNMLSGENTNDSGAVMKQEHWPHNLVSHASAKKPQKHSELSMLQFQEGFLAKILLEADPALLETKVKNKMLFFHYISKLSYSLPWPQVLEVAAKFFRGLEHMRFSWDDWSLIHAHLQTSFEQVKIASIQHKFNGGGGNFQGGAAGGGQNPGPPKQADTVGVPHNWMRSKNFCIKWNQGHCTIQVDANNSHVFAEGKSAVQHLCAGCFVTGNKHEKGHGASNCSKKPFQSSLFR